MSERDQIKASSKTLQPLIRPIPQASLTVCRMLEKILGGTQGKSVDCLSIITP